MIGVLPKAGQIKVVEEFFELFKTPWELYRPEHEYDVIIVTADVVPEIRPRLLLVYNATSVDLDLRIGLTGHKSHEGAVRHRDVALPIYGNLLVFADDTGRIDAHHCLHTNSGPVGVTVGASGSTVVRLGYDLFDQVRFLLATGQPLEYAHIPTLDIHIEMIRKWILEAGIPFVEIPPTPAGYRFFICLTHDIDFLGIRNHKFDHSMWGFIFRATAGSLLNLMRSKTSLRRVVKNWLAVASLPFVYAGWMKDFWVPFEWYLEVEKGLPATYFVIPFKRRCGEKVPGTRVSRRAAAYDVGDLLHWIPILLDRGCELGVHGIDAWHNVEKARAELARIEAATGSAEIGVRMHWLLNDANTPSTLEQAGYAYDSTVGYNETIGYRAGTSQVFRPESTQTILELPLHIQDGALFLSQRLNLSEQEAEKRCQTIIDNAGKYEGVITVLWHDRSHAPERLWGDFYIKLVQALKATNAWFATGAQVINWFRKRRNVWFEYVKAPGGSQMRIRYEGGEIQPPLRIRVYKAWPRQHGPICALNTECVEFPWNGRSVEELERQMCSRLSTDQPDIAPCLPS